MLKIYLFENPEMISDELLNRSMALLPIERRKKANRYKHSIDKKMCVISYLLLLYGLKENYGIIFPKISYESNGKPYLTDYPDIFFNISHCRYACVCALSDRIVGIDIQDIRPFSWDIARRVCSKNELKMLENADDKSELFTKFWTIKESYLKMTGEGISKISFVDTTTLDNHIDVWKNYRYIAAVSV